MRLASLQPKLAPTFLGADFATSQLECKWVRSPFGGHAVPAIVQVRFPTHLFGGRFMQQVAQRKRSRVASQREPGGVEPASRMVRLRIDPFRGPRRSTDETFAYLREHRLSFFSDR